MKLEDQVLSIDQVRELQELGFDVKKNASMVWINNRLFSKDDTTTQCMIVQVDYTPTMTIGDIIEVLPTEIGKYVLNINKIYVSYYDSKTNILFYAYRYRFINSLFDCLVWCIKEKHIAL